MLHGVGRNLIAQGAKTQAIVPVRYMAAAATAQPKGRKDKSVSKKVVHSKSFVQNIFRGIVEPAQAFPYPKVIQLFILHYSS
jgi:hypothetical protein